jgi:hypothetical protein
MEKYSYGALKIGRNVCDAKKVCFSQKSLNPILNERVSLPFIFFALTPLLTSFCREQ